MILRGTGSRAMLAAVTICLAAILVMDDLVMPLAVSHPGRPDWIPWWHDDLESLVINGQECKVVPVSLNDLPILADLVRGTDLHKFYFVDYRTDQTRAQEIYEERTTDLIRTFGFGGRVWELETGATKYAASR